MSQHLENQASPQKTIRLMRPSVVVLCGPAACGKSRFAARHFRPTQIISSDQARALVCDDERDQRFQAQAFALVHFLIERRLELNRLCVVDSTALTPAARKNLLELARKHQVPCVVFLFTVPLEKCIERDAARERTVGRAVIERQYELFVQAAASIRQEGFDQVVEIPDADIDRVRIEVVFRPPARRPAVRQRPQPRANAPHTAPGDRRGPGSAVGRSAFAAPGPASPASRPAPAMAVPTPAPGPAPVQSPVPVPTSPRATPVGASAPEARGVEAPASADPHPGSNGS